MKKIIKKIKDYFDEWMEPNQKEFIEICENCGEAVKIKEIRGSEKYPICKDCFLSRYKGDYKKYFNELKKRGLA